MVDIFLITLRDSLVQYLYSTSHMQNIIYTVNPEHEPIQLINVNVLPYASLKNISPPNKIPPKNKDRVQYPIKAQTICSNREISIVFM